MRADDRTRRTAGFSTLELLVALVISAIVTAEMLGLFSSQLQTHTAQKRVLDTQEDARLIADIVLADARTAGFMVPTFAGVSSVDGGAGAPDRICVSDPDVIDPGSLAAATARFDRARLAANLGAGANSVQLVLAEMDIDGDGDNDFSPGQGIIISDGTRTHCALILTRVANLLVFGPATPAGFSVTTANSRAVPAVIYQIFPAGLMRNNQLLSPKVEDLQVEFAVDTDGDGLIGAGEFPIHSLDGAVINRLRGAQFSVLTRTSREDPKLEGPGRQAVANRAASGVPDNYRRRLVTATAAFRNIL